MMRVACGRLVLLLLRRRVRRTVLWRARLRVLLLEVLPVAVAASAAIAVGSGG
jgi:hypothetical protein